MAGSEGHGINEKAWGGSVENHSHVRLECQPAYRESEQRTSRQAGISSPNGGGRQFADIEMDVRSAVVQRGTTPDG